MRGQAFIAATALILASVQPAAAQQYRDYHDEHVVTQEQCQRARNGNTAAGAVVGGLLGAVLGSQVSGSGRRGDGSLLGGVIGAATGAAIARGNTRCEQVPQGSYDPYSGQGYGQGPYKRDDSGLEGGPYQESAYGRDYGRDYARGDDCRMGQLISRDPDGREYRENVMMCQGRDGVWRPQD
jgi:Glycine zipper 2TM domain